MKAISRLYDYLNYKGVKPTVFEREIGFSSGYLSVMKKRNADLGESAFVKINDYCHDLSISWLLTGQGEMLRKSQPDIMEHSHNNKELLDRIERLSAENALLRRDIENLKNKDVRRNHEDNSSFPRAVTADAELRESTKNK